MKHCFKVKNACVLVSDVKKLPFNIWLVDLHLHEKIKVSPLYYFGKVKNVVMVRLDHIKYVDFFACSDTADFYKNEGEV